MVIRSASHRSIRPRQTVQTIGPYTFAIPDVPPQPKQPEGTSLVSQLRQALTTILTPPLMFAFITTWTALVWLSPTRSIRQWILSKCLPIVYANLEKRMLNQRQLLLQHCSGRVLDVGSGGGAYLRLLAKKPVTYVVALEPMEALHSKLREAVTSTGRLAEFQVTISTDTLDDYAAKHAADDPSFDWIILGNVLCEVPDQQRALESVNKLIKPGGFVYFSEHIAAPRGTWLRHMQDALNPWWRSVSGGCNCNRETLFALEGMEDWEIISWECKNIKALGGPFVIGLARKVSGC